MRWRGTNENLQSRRYDLQGLSLLEDGQSTADETVGWNTEYQSYKSTNITPKRIRIKRRSDEIELNRQTIKAKGKQYHTKHHEYFYAEIPKEEPRY